MPLIPLARIDKQELPSSFNYDWRGFKRVRQALDALDALERSADLMERELEQFLEAYYARVLPLTQRLERLRYRKKHGIFPAATTISSDELFQLPKASSALRSKRKIMFRRLAKRCHPDSRGGISPITIMEVYQAKTIGALWLLEIRYMSDILLHDDMLLHRYLTEQEKEIRHMMVVAQDAKSELSRSHAWVLKERVYFAALKGVDLVEHIQRRIENQIVALQKHFVKPRKLAQKPTLCS